MTPFPKRQPVHQRGLLVWSTVRRTKKRAQLRLEIAPKELAALDLPRASGDEGRRSTGVVTGFAGGGALKLLHGSEPMQREVALWCSKETRQ